MAHHPIVNKEDAGAGGWPRVAIVGAGISGICAGIRLRYAGFGNIVILEKASRVGGTWRDNIYPGAACDIPAHLYSYSFAATGSWSRKYATQREILAYLEDCVRKSDLESCIRFGADVVAASYDDTSARWRIGLAEGTTVEADILITACGQLHRPFVPDIPGRDSFAGPSFHSAQWRDDCELAHRAVAVIGSAASAIQIVPAIASKVRRLTVFQRSPNWFSSRWDRSYSRWTRSIFTSMPWVRRLYRGVQYFAHELYVLGFRSGSLTSRIMTALNLARLRRNVADETLRAALTPDYPVGCKRVLRASSYLRLFIYETNALVADPIERIVPEGVVTRDGRLHAADVIVYATGFNASEFLAPMEIRGRGDKTLNEAWAHGAEAYLGTTVPGFPNFFVLYGPNTNLGHNSVIFMIECQVSYIIRLLQHMKRSGAAEIDVRNEAMDRFRQELTRRMSATAWSGDCRSFYKNEAGRVVGIWPYSSIRFWWMTSRPRFDDYVFRSPQQLSATVLPAAPAIPALT